MPNVNPFATKIENRYFEIYEEDLSIGEIIDRHATTGESVVTVKKNLEKKLNMEISRTTMWNLIKYCIAEKKVTYRINARFKNNPLRKIGTGCKPELKDDMFLREAIFSCDNCNNSTEEEITIKFLGNSEWIGLESYQCGHCGAVGTCKAIILKETKYGGKYCFIASLKEVDGITQEIHEQDFSKKYILTKETS